MKTKLISLAILAAFSHSVFADEPARTWDATAELGINVTTGNTKTSSLKTRVDVKKAFTEWDTTYVFDALKKKDDGNVSANKWIFSAQGDYKLIDPNTFLFVTGSREEDQLGSFDNYNSVAAGYGSHFYNTKTLTIGYDLGPGYAVFERNDGLGEKESSTLVRFSANLKWLISDSATFSQKVIVNQELSKDKNGDKNRMTRLESSVSAKINGSLKMKFGITVLNNSEVAVGRKKTDTETSMTLVYAF